MSEPRTIAPAEGKLGVLTVGLGAVATTLIAGVELTKRGIGLPFGSMTQMGTIRLGKRTDGRSPLIKVEATAPRPTVRTPSFPSAGAMERVSDMASTLGDRGGPPR